MFSGNISLAHSQEWYSTFNPGLTLVDEEDPVHSTSFAKLFVCSTAYLGKLTFQAQI